MKKWAVALVAVVGMGVFGLVTLVGLGAYVFATHVDVERGATEASARQSFDEARRVFSDQRPLLTMGTDGPEVDRDALPSPGEPNTLRVLAWEASEERLVSLRLPMWLVRLANDGNVEFDTDERDSFSLDLRVDDLLTHGPGLVLDYSRDGHERVLVWTE